MIQYYQIQSWMTTELNLKGLEKEIFAIIHSFQEHNQECHCSLSEFAKTTGYCRRNIVYSLEKLISNGFIEKEEIYINSLKLCKYKVSKKTSAKIAPLVQSLQEGSAKIALGVVQSLHGGSAKFAPNNKDIIKDNNKDILETNFEHQEQANGKLTSVEFRNSRDYQYISDVYQSVYGCKLPCRKQEQLMVIKNWFSDIPNFTDSFELVLRYFKEKYKWANNPHPPFSWLVKDGLSYQAVYTEWFEKEGQYIGV